VIEEANYSVAELAELGGVSRRTIRYYIQEDLLPPPLGVGRGRHYADRHLEQLLRVKSMQERGMTLEEIRGTLRGRQGALLEAVTAVPRTSWTRIELVPGLELHVSAEFKLPGPSKIAELAEWCRSGFLPRK
jgi:DNA-binding transcriptional MerR regulator